MAKTANDVVTKALRALNVIGSQETPTAEDSATALEDYTSFHNELMADLDNTYRLKSAKWSKDSVPENVFSHVSQMAAFYMTSSFPVSSSVYGRVQAQAARAMPGVVKIMSGRKFSNSRFPTMPTSAKHISASINS